MSYRIIKGFTLIELMIVIVIIAILATSASSFLKSDKYIEENQVDLMFDLIKVSKIRAFQDRKTVIICSSGDRESCNTSSPWQGRFVIAFISEDGTNNFDTNNDTIIASVEAQNANYYYDWSSFPNSSFIKITNRGHGMNGVLTLCNQNKAYKRMLINFRGNVSIEDPATNAHHAVCNA